METDSVTIPLEIAGADAATEGCTRLETALRSMRREFAHGVEGAKGLGEAFKALSGEGQITTTTLLELSKVPVALSSPVGAATLAIGLLVQGFKSLREEGQPTKQELQDIKDGMVDLKAESEAYFRTIVDGGGQEEAQLNRLAVMKTKAYQDEQAQVFEQIQEREKSIDQLQKQAEALGGVVDEEGTRAIATASGIEIVSEATETNKAHNEAVRQVQAQLGGEKKAIEDLKAVLEQHANYVGGQVHAYKAEEEQIKKTREELEKLSAEIDASDSSGEGKSRTSAQPYGDLGVNLPAVVSDAQLKQDQALVDEQKKTEEAITHSWDVIGKAAESAVKGLIKPAFDDYVTSIDNLVNHQGKGFDLIRGGYKTMTADILKSIGEQAFAQGIFMEAKALVDLAQGIAGNPAAMAAAGEDAIAGAEMLAVAAALGAASGAMGGGGGAGATASAGASTAPAGGAGGGGAGGVTQQIIVIGQLDASQAEDLQQQLATAQQRRSLSS